MSTVAAACPGQGVDPRDVAATLERHADDALVARLTEWSGGRRWASADLTDTRLAQPAVYVASVAAGRAHSTSWDAAVGHSLGELAAAVLAGALDPDDGFDLVLARAGLGREAHERRQGRMLVVMRVDDVTLEWARRAALGTAGGVLEVAVRNGPGQVVLAGDVATTEAAAAIVADAGGVARALPIGGGYHTPLLAGAVPALHARLAAVARAPRATLVSSTACRPLVDADDVAECLARSLVLPVRWPEAVGAVADTGIERLVDVGPGTTLANLARHAPLLPTDALEDPG